MSKINSQIKSNEKKAIILYDSKYGNTKRVALAISRGLEAGGVWVDCLSINEFDLNDLSDYEIIGIGSPTHFRRPSKVVREFLTLIKPIKLHNKYGFAFETKAMFTLAGSAGNKIYSVLKKKKLKLLRDVITGVVTEDVGPLKENTLSKMEQIGIELAENLKLNS